MQLLPAEILVTVLQTRYTRIEESVENFKGLAQCRLIGHLYRHLIDTQIYPHMRQLPGHHYNYADNEEYNHWLNRITVSYCDPARTIDKKSLRFFPGLQKLTLYENDKINGHTLQYNTALTSLTLAYCSDKIRIKHLSTLSNLTRLVITGFHRGLSQDFDVEDTNRYTPPFDNLPALVSLELRKAYIDVDSVSRLTCLQSLLYEPGDVQVFDPWGDYALSQLTSLTSLALYDYNIKHIGHLTRLTTLSLGCESSVDDDNLGQLINMTALDIHECPTEITSRGVESLIGLRSLTMDNAEQIDESVLLSLANLSTLRLTTNQCSHSCHECISQTLISRLPHGCYVYCGYLCDEYTVDHFINRKSAWGESHGENDDEDQ